MRFERLKLRGFLSFGEDECTVKMANSGLVLIEGENRDDPTVDNNGSGKSSLSEALLWCLFGRTLRGVTGDQIVNRHLESGVGCKVEVTFANDAGEVFTVTRYRQDAKHKNKLVFVGPTKELTANETSETEAKVRDALGMDFETFTSAVVFGQGQTKHFASMTDKEMKRVTDKLIGVESLSKAYDAANHDFKQLEEEDEVLREQLLALDREAAEDALTAAKNDRDGWASAQEKQEKQFVAQLKALVRPDLDDLKLASEAAEKYMVKADRGFNGATLEAKNARDHARDKLAEVTRLTKALETLTDKTGTCAHCGQRIDGAALKAHRSQLERDLGLAEEVYETANIRAKSYEREAVEAHAEAKKAEKAVSAALLAVANGKAEARQYDASAEMLEKFRKQTNPHHGAVERAQKAFDEVVEKGKLIKQARAEIGAEFEVLRFITTMFSDKGAPDLPPLKGLLVESVAPVVNKHLDRYAQIFTDGNMEVTFETTSTTKAGEHREHYRLDAVNRYGASAYEESSGGEKRKIDLIVFFAFQAIAASRARERVGFAIYDEIFDALDETAQEVVMDLLQEERKSKDTVWVITQRSELKGYFQKSLRVVKSGGNSSVVAT